MLNFSKLDPAEEHFRIPGPHPGLKLFLRYLPAVPRDIQGGHQRERKPVLYVHGATFPSALSIAHRFDRRSWRDALNDAGFDVWAFDFHGFGYSDPYREMDEPAAAHSPLCDAKDASRQLEAVVRFILEHHGASRLSLISHSWGSMPAGRLAGTHPEMVDRWVLFGPVARRPPRRYEQAPSGPAWRIVTVEDQWKRFVEDVPPDASPVLSPKHFDEWGERYLDSDSGSRTRTPAGVKIPSGPFADILRAWHGDLGYDPGLVRAPIALIRGEWDGIVPDEDARWLFDAFTGSPIKRDIKISRATHLMHLESMRAALYRETNSFLLEHDQLTGPASDQGGGG
jgi:pimeloyl-ACP methyl ester carboxylesterase